MTRWQIRLHRLMCAIGWHERIWSEGITPPGMKCWHCQKGLDR